MVVFLSKALDNKAAPASSIFVSDDCKQSVETQKLSQQPAPLALNKNTIETLKANKANHSTILDQDRAKSRTPPQNQIHQGWLHTHWTGSEYEGSCSSPKL
jgi:hypothetical protein